LDKKILDGVLKIGIIVNVHFFEIPEQLHNSKTGRRVEICPELK
jgi:hypothetical protein